MLRARGASSRQRPGRGRGRAGGPGGGGAYGFGSWDRGPPTLIFPCDFFWGAENVGPGCDHCADWADQAFDAGNANVMVLCDELERRVVTPVVTPAAGGYS